MIIAVISIILRDIQIFRKSRSHLIILLARLATWSKFHTKDEKSLVATVPDIVTQDLCTPEIYNHIQVVYFHIAFIYNILYIIITYCLFFPMAQQPLGGLGRLTIEASRSHSDTPHSVGLLWTSDQPAAETSTWQHTTLIRQTSMLQAEFEPTIPVSERP
jgi:hypothetical protein